MCKLIFLNIFVVMLLVGTGLHADAATIAEASVNNEKLTVGSYDLSGMTESEREWFETFLKGNLFADGWEEISAEIIDKTDDHERHAQVLRLHELGFKIGSEWCKDNDIRKITTDNLRKWGKELKNTAEDAPHRLSEVILRIDSEVNRLIN